MPDATSATLAARFALVAGGWFTMGSDHGQDDERPGHRVFVDAFELGVYPVTRAEYAAFLTATGHEPPCDWSHPPFAPPDLPVVGVSWCDAVAYCAWRSDREGCTVRLPTEAEWEFAARGGGDALLPWGDALPSWFPNGGRGPLEAPWPVTLGDPTGLGLYGITTNIHEWCADWHSQDYYGRSPALNPAGPEHGIKRAARGGAWRHAQTWCRATARSKLMPSFRYNDFGFRVARGV